MPTKAALSVPSSAGQGCENMAKGSRVEIRFREKSLTDARHGQNRLDLEKSIYFIANQIPNRTMRNKS